MQQPADDEQGEADVSAALSVLHGATILARHAISDADHEAAPEVLQVAAREKRQVATAAHQRSAAPCRVRVLCRRACVPGK